MRDPKSVLIWEDKLLIRQRREYVGWACLDPVIVCIELSMCVNDATFVSLIRYVNYQIEEEVVVPHPPRLAAAPLFLSSSDEFRAPKAPPKAPSDGKTSPREASPP